MLQPIKVRNSRYFPYGCLKPGGNDATLCSDIQSRQSFVSHKELRLDRTNGAFVMLGDKPLLLIIDRRTVDPGSEEWRFIGQLAEHLERCWPQLSAQAKSALESLVAVVFSTAPARAYADVKPNCFVYDVDEFRRSDGSLISPAYAASNIVHDANHVWMYDHGQAHTGNDAETVCWKLQIANAQALALDAWDVQFLQKLVNEPAIVTARIEQNPFEVTKLACSQMGKCGAVAHA